MFMYSFEDILAEGALVVDGLRVDTHVDIIVHRVNETLFEIDSSTFGEKEVRIITDSDKYVVVTKDGNGKFYQQVSDALDLLALKTARMIFASRDS